MQTRDRWLAHAAHGRGVRLNGQGFSSNSLIQFQGVDDSGRLGTITVSPRTVSGTIHHAATLLAFTCAYMTVAEATPLLAATVGEPLTGLLSALKHVISLTFVAVVLTITPPLRRYFGLVERIFLYATALWFLTATLTLPPL